MRVENTSVPTILQLTRDVARYLGQKWTVESYEDITNQAWLQHKNGWRLYMSSGRDRRRIKISGQYEQAGWWNLTRVENPRITVARQRGATVIAKEIQRRLLPEYSQWFTEIEAKHREYLARKNTELDTLNLLAEVSHGHVRGLPQGRDGVLSMEFGYGKVSNFYNGRLKLELEE